MQVDFSVHFQFEHVISLRVLFVVRFVGSEPASLQKLRVHLKDINVLDLRTEGLLIMISSIDHQLKNKNLYWIY